jgi:hypothetical protein
LLTLALQFGKTGDDEFTMDYTYPFNAIQVRFCGVGFVGAASVCKDAAVHRAMHSRLFYFKN